jgi:hypothetical protein
LVFACKLSVQSIPQSEPLEPLREEANENTGSGDPLEAIGWKKYSRCMR